MQRLQQHNEDLADLLVMEKRENAALKERLNAQRAECWTLAESLDSERAERRRVVEQNAKLRGALSWLVRLKDYVKHLDFERYRTEKDDAWSTARAALTGKP
jgi:hypothetical protein